MSEGLLVAGSRGITDFHTVAAAIKYAFSAFPIRFDHLISGGARGVDKLAERWAAHHGWVIRVMPADWEQHGRSAGMIRNREMVRVATAAVFVWDGKSKGTAQGIYEAGAAHLPHIVLNLGDLDPSVLGSPYSNQTLF